MFLLLLAIFVNKLKLILLCFIICILHSVLLSFCLTHTVKCELFYH